MLDLNGIRRMMAEYLSDHANHRHSLDAAVMHVVRVAYQQGISDGSTSSRRELQQSGDHPAPCASHCESNAYQIEIRRLKREIESMSDSQRIVVTYNGRALPITDAGTDYRTWQRDNLERLATALTRRMVEESRND